MPGTPALRQWKRTILSSRSSSAAPWLQGQPRKSCLKKEQSTLEKKFLASWSLTLLSLPSRDSTQDGPLACSLFSGTASGHQLSWLSFRLVSDTIIKKEAMWKADWKAKQTTDLFWWPGERNNMWHFSSCQGCVPALYEDQGKSGDIPCSSLSTQPQAWAGYPGSSHVGRGVVHIPPLTQRQRKGAGRTFFVMASYISTPNSSVTSSRIGFLN